MNPAYKTRTSDEALDEHLQQLKASVANRKQQNGNNSNIASSNRMNHQSTNNKVQSHQKTYPPPPPSQTSATNLPPAPPALEPPVTNTITQAINSASAARLRGDSSATSIYVTAGDSHAYFNHVNSSNPGTMERKQEHRLSWTNMRRRGDGLEATMQQPAITPSPQTTRSYISNITTTELHSNRDDDRIDGHGYRDSGGGGGGTGALRNASISGRTTTSGRASSVDGVTTICGSSNTLNDIHSDYHSQDVGGSREFNNFSRIISGSVVDGIGAASSPKKHKLRNSHLNYSSANGSFNMANGSTVKLISQADDEANKQVSFAIV